MSKDSKIFIAVFIAIIILSVVLVIVYGSGSEGEITLPGPRPIDLQDTA